MKTKFMRAVNLLACLYSTLGLGEFEMARYLEIIAESLRDVGIDSERYKDE